MAAVKEKVVGTVSKAVLNYLDKDPENNIPKVMDWIEKFDKTGELKPHMREVRKAWNDTDGNWHKLIMSLWSDVDAEQRKVFFEDFVVNASITGGMRQHECQKKYNCNIPWSILMDPTTACNLNCVGCWAAEYGSKYNMSYETMDDIINQANELGCYFFLYTGGEPTVRRKDLMNLCRAHPDTMFGAFTNATLIDEDFADEIKSVKNFIPVISIEGFEETTDARRGKGTYQKIIDAMKILREKKLIFGASVCYTSQNVDYVGSEEYFDYLIELGCKFAWFFTYMPVGKESVPELMCTAEQREFMYHQLRKFRETKPLFTIDFWNDGQYVGGCIAGGRAYLHINANGDIEPCAFIHYSDSSVYDKTLLEAFQSPLFMGYHNNQPFNDNMLRPCPVLDNPGRLTKIVEESGAKSTDYQAQESAKEYSDKCVDKAVKWKPVADKLWQEQGKELGSELGKIGHKA